MIVTVEQTVNATYGALEQVLLKLGFKALRGINEFGLPCVVYENKVDASIALPARPEEDRLYGSHCTVAVRTIGGGVSPAMRHLTKCWITEREKKHGGLIQRRELIRRVPGSVMRGD